MSINFIRYAGIIVGLASMTNLAIDHSVWGESRWPSDRERFQAAPPALAEMLINDFAARDDVMVLEMQRYEPGREIRIAQTIFRPNKTAP